ELRVLPVVEHQRLGGATAANPDRGGDSEHPPYGPAPHRLDSTAVSYAITAPSTAMRTVSPAAGVSWLDVAAVTATRSPSRRRRLTRVWPPKYAAVTT